MNSSDPFDLQRFVAAQDRSYGRIVAELRSGRKRSHWIWYVFPQITGLGSSATSRLYALSGLSEARAYLEHPTLGPRLLECTQLVLDTGSRDIGDIFPGPDDLKFRSCMTLFQQAAPADPIFGAALDRFFNGSADPRTLRLLTGPN